MKPSNKKPLCVALREYDMKLTIKSTLAALVASTILAMPVSAELSGNLKIFLDTSNPAPRATMEEMIGRFQEKHPNMNIETTCSGIMS